MRKINLTIVNILFLLGVISAIPTLLNLKKVQYMCDDAYRIFRSSMEDCKPDFWSGKIKKDFGINMYNSFLRFVFTPCVNEFKKIGCITHLKNEAAIFIENFQENINSIKEDPSESYDNSFYYSDIALLDHEYNRFVAKLSLGEPSCFEHYSEIVVLSID